jgi:alkylation response protein AidB-like acyl-CoA dehydrogenase
VTVSAIPTQRGLARVTIRESSERDAMMQTVRSALAAHSSIARVAAVADGPDPYDAALWQRLSSELGITGVLVPTQFGGLGLGWREARVVLAELGRCLACVPFLSSCVVAPTVLLAGVNDGAVAGDLLPRIADGTAIVAVALGDASLHSCLPATPVEARPAGGAGWQLTGTAMFVADAAGADYVLILARMPDDTIGWFAVATDRPGVRISPMSAVDETRPVARVELVDALARAAGRYASCNEALASVLDAAITGLACEQSAASQYLLEQTVAYCKTRYQFGQPIGSFQAVQHRLADLAVAVDTSVSAVEYAIWAACDDPERWPEAASIAGFTCAETMFTVGGETIQLHGGIGFTWEHFAHRYYRRALGSRAQFGQPSWHRERLLAALAI